MNEQYNALRREGYQYTGATLDCWKDRAIIEARAKEYKVLGNKVKIVRKTDVTDFRDRKDKHTYWVVMVLYSEEWKKAEEEKRAARKKAEHEGHLMKMAAELSLEDIAFILRFKASTLAAYPAGTLALYDIEEKPVEVVRSNPAKEGREGFDYRIKFADGHEAWVNEADLGFEDENGNPIKKV